MSLVPQVKLGMPLLPADFVERGELRAELDAAAGAGTTLVCAPSGYGKTLVLADWVTRPPPVETAWVTIDGGGNDPRRLWASVLAALAAHTSLEASNSIPSWSAWSAAEHTEFVAELVDELHSLPNPIRLILDDLGELTDPEALRGLQLLAGNVSSQVHLVLSSRFDPPLGLDRLRRAGRLREIRADRLRFTSAESATLLARAGLRLTAAQLKRLHQRTNGWAAGLRLAALALTDVPDPDRFLADFSRDGRCVADYLTGEILNRLSSETLAFLRAISIPDPLSPQLAVALSGCADAGAVLDSLEHDTSLLSAVDRQRDAYRLQPQLRTYLLAEVLTRPARSRSAGSSTGLDGHAVLHPAAHVPAHDRL